MHPLEPAETAVGVAASHYLPEEFVVGNLICGSGLLYTVFPGDLARQEPHIQSLGKGQYIVRFGLDLRRKGIPDHVDHADFLVFCAV